MGGIDAVIIASGMLRRCKRGDRVRDEVPAEPDLFIVGSNLAPLQGGFPYGVPKLLRKRFDYRQARLLMPPNPGSLELNTAWSVVIRSHASTQAVFYVAKVSRRWDTGVSALGHCFLSAVVRKILQQVG